MGASLGIPLVKGRNLPCIESKLATNSNSFFSQGFQIFLPLFAQGVVGVGVSPFEEVFEEDEAEAVVTEFIGVHFSPQGVGYVPELSLEFLFLGFGH
jgi:hypothetical protein